MTAAQGPMLTKTACRFSHRVVRTGRRPFCLRAGTAAQNKNVRRAARAAKAHREQWAAANKPEAFAGAVSVCARQESHLHRKTAARWGGRWQSAWDQRLCGSSEPLTCTVTTCSGSRFPLLRRALRTAFSSPPQQGTSMRATVTLRMLLLCRICVSFSL